MAFFKGYFHILFYIYGGHMTKLLFCVTVITETILFFFDNTYNTLA